MAWHSVSQDHNTLTEHYMMWSAHGAWDSGTLTFDVSKDRKHFRLQGNLYVDNAQVSIPWIPGTNQKYGGIQTFYLGIPEDGIARWCYGGGLLVGTSSSTLSVGNINYDLMFLGTDGFLYLMGRSSKPSTAHPQTVSYYGWETSVDSMVKFNPADTTYSGYTYGNGKK